MPTRVQPCRPFRARTCRAVLAGVLLAVWPATPAAQGDVAMGSEPVSPAPSSRFELGVYAGAFMPDDGHEFYDWRVVMQEPLEPVGPEIGVRAAFYPIRFLGIEGEADVLPQATESGAGVMLYGLRAHLVVQAPAKITPFLLGGFGTMGVRSTNDALASDDDVLGHLGLGVKIHLGEGFALRAEGRVLRAPQAGNTEGTNHFAVLLGASFALGRRTSPPPVIKPVAPEPAAPIEPPLPVDTDVDGVVDASDRCADQPEDKDGFEDADGCPDPDNDADQVADVDDRCPAEAGTADNRGCPDRDKDGDNVVDRVDNCPDQPGSAANQGCVDRQLVVLDGDHVRLLDPVTFTTGKSEVRRRSLRVLDNLAAVLTAHPTLLARIRVAGHTDDRGDPDYNKQLSQQRADAVKAHLVSRGVAADRIEAIGVGEEKPLEPNTTATGRARNRRVEVDIVDTAAPAIP